MNRLAFPKAALTAVEEDSGLVQEGIWEAFEHHPFGIALVDRTGTLIAMNRAAAELLGHDALGHGGRPATCCDLLRCGAADGPPQRRCLTQLALELDEPLPDVRIDLGPDRDAAAWVSAAPSPSGVVISLRPGVPGDRRRRTEPHWVAGPKLQVRTFGSTSVASGESSLDGSWLEHRTGRLLKYLVAQRGRPTHAEQIIAALWPNSGPEAVGTLRQCVHALRDRLEPNRSKHDGSAFILSRNGGYELDCTRVSIDADEFATRARAGLDAAAKGQARNALASLAAAMELYRGDFLGDEPYAEWAFSERDHLRDLAARVLRAISEIHVASGELDRAAEHLQRLTQIDPFDVDVQRQLIGVYLGAGRHSQAVRRYERLRQQMHNAFGEKLDFELRDITREASRPAEPRAASGRSPR